MDTKMRMKLQENAISNQLLQLNTSDLEYFSSILSILSTSGLEYIFEEPTINC